MPARRRYAAVLLVLLALALVFSACGDDEDGPLESDPIGPPDTPPSGAYVALGDSIAAGTGASDPATKGYVALIARALGAEPEVGERELLSLAVPGHTTEDLFNEQLGPAVQRLQQGGVGLVTITIGWNDLSPYYDDPACLPDPSEPACPLEDGLLEVERLLDATLADLREAGPEAAIVIQTYPNFLAGVGHGLARPTDIALMRLNGVITAVARRHDALVADTYSDFQGRGTQLTHMGAREPDFHPNDEGHRVIADAFLEALGLPAVE